MTDQAQPLRITDRDLRSTYDVSSARQQARRVAELAGLSIHNQTRFATAVAEIAFNAWKHAGAGSLELSLVGVGPRQAIQAIVCDDGPGIANAETLLSGTLPRRAAASTGERPRGLGLAGARRLVDQFSVDTHPQRGTVIVLRQWLPARRPQITPDEVATWTTQLATTEDAGSPNVVQQQNEELLAALDQLHRKERRLKRQLARIKQLNEQLAALSLVASKTDNGVIITDAEGRIEWVNDGFTRISGYRLEDVQGRRPGEALQGPATDPQAIERLRAGLRSGQSFTQEILNYHKQGHTYWVSLNISPIYDELGRLERYIAIQSDITEHKLNEQDLQDAKEAAEAANRSKSEFLANISHEIRTPMNAIMGMTDLALGTKLTGEQREFLTTVKHSADSLLRLLNDLLDFSKIEAGKFEIDRSPFRLRETLDAAIRSLAVEAHRKGLELLCHVPSEVPDALVGDATRLRQIIFNLMGNAIKFTDEGEIVIRVEVESRAAQRSLLRFSVRDTGIGIATEQQQRIFVPFTQGDASLNRPHSGTGLGLAISAQLVNMMGGRIWVRSQPGRGSTFNFTAWFDQATEALPTTMVALEAADVRDMPVLIVDDNATNRQILSEALTNWQMRPRAMGSADAALAEMRRAADLGRPYPLVLVDARMPTRDGFDLAESIRESPSLAEATIMMLSSADQKQVQRCRELGISAYLTKPVSQSDLLETILRTVSDADPETKEQAAPVRIRRTHRRRHVLVAEDTPANQRLVAKLLQQRGHEVRVVETGRQAVVAWESEPFDVILMDVQMPDMDGYEATRQIRQVEEERDEDTPGTPIVAMTAHAMKGDRERCLAAGMDAYISKPIDAQQMLSLVESFPSRQAAGSESVLEAMELEESVGEGSSPSNSALMQVDSGNGSGKQAASSGNGHAEPPRQEAAVRSERPAEQPGSPQAAEQPQPLDEKRFEAAIARLNGSVKLFLDVVGFFMQDAPELLTRLRVALACGEAKQVRRAAHSLKGLASTFDDAPSVESAARLEQLAKDDQLDEAEPEAENLRLHIRRLLELLEQFRPEHADEA